MLLTAVEQPIAQNAGSTTTAAPAIFDMEPLLSRVGGARELMIEVMRLFLDDYPIRLESICGRKWRRTTAALFEPPRMR